MLFYEHSAWCIASWLLAALLKWVGQREALDWTIRAIDLLASEITCRCRRSRQEVNKMVQYLLTKYGARCNGSGQKFQECFDLATGTPEQEYLKMHREIRREMMDQLGLQLTDASPYI
jgi:hypothetical protein